MSEINLKTEKPFAYSDAEQILGRKLKKGEKMLVDIYGTNKEFKWYKHENGGLAASKTGREEKDTF